MEKPQTTSVKDWLISLTAKKLEIPEAVCDTLINWAYIKAKEATLTNSHVEFSGYGKIYASPSKIKRCLLKAEEKKQYLQSISDEGDDEATILRRQKKIEELQLYISYLKSKKP